MQVQECLDEYAFVYLFQVDNMRNTKLKDVRSKWLSSRCVVEIYGHYI